MRHPKPSGRYGPQRTCAQCHQHTEKPYVCCKTFAICSQQCLDKWDKQMEREREEKEKEIEGWRRAKHELQEEKEKWIHEAREFERTIQGHYKLIEKVHKQLDLAGVPTGGNILDRLEYLVEEHLATRKYVPRVSYILEDD